jgi:hypothetical protein
MITADSKIKSVIWAKKVLRLNIKIYITCTSRIRGWIRNYSNQIHILRSKNQNLCLKELNPYEWMATSFWSFITSRSGCENKIIIIQQNKWQHHETFRGNNFYHKQTQEYATSYKNKLWNVCEAWGFKKDVQRLETTQTEILLTSPGTTKADHQRNKCFKYYW